MTPCQEFDVLLTLRATGDLEPEEAARLEVHLAACPRCRAEADADAAALRKLRLPGPDDAERRATARLARDTLAALHREDGRAAAWKRFAVAFVAAAAVVLAILAPALLAPRTPVSPARLVAADASGDAASTSSWEPDLDTVWGDTAILDDGSASASGFATDTTVASAGY
jgi:anti-sigma factor RsiW